MQHRCMEEPQTRAAVALEAVRRVQAALSTQLQLLIHRAATRPAALSVAIALFLGLASFAHLPYLAALVGIAAMAAVIVSIGEGGEETDAANAAVRQTGGLEKGPQRLGDQEVWRTLVDALPDAAVVLGRSGMVLHHNALVRDLFPNIRPGQPLGLAARNPELNAAIDRAYGAAEPVVVQFFERVPVERRISVTASNLGRLAAGARQQPALLVTFRDLTEQDRLAQMRADFVANASHELRTPLASLRGFVETLQGPAKDDPAAREKFLGIMSRQAARMTRLIDDLLSLSRVEMRIHLPPRGVVDLSDVGGFVTQAMEPLASGSHMTLSFVRAEGPVRIRGEREEIVQVLQNLVHNAIKYGRDGGHVQVTVSRALEGQPSVPKLIVSVHDDGPGIAAEHLPRLTERFYRVSAAASREKGGTGLGLAIVKHIVLRHRGDLRIASEVGKGSTFTVVFDELTTAPGACLERAARR